jgi:hypothetical protein
LDVRMRMRIGSTHRAWATWRQVGEAG